MVSHQAKQQTNEGPSLLLMMYKLLTILRAFLSQLKTFEHQHMNLTLNFIMIVIHLHNFLMTEGRLSSLKIMTKLLLFPEAESHQFAVTSHDLFGNQNQLLHKMQQTPSCGFLFCKGEAASLQESAQEQLSSNYSQEMVIKTLKMTEGTHAYSPQLKEIFSFKLNCFRNLPNSDKPHSITENLTMKASQTAINFQNCRSTERKLLKLNHSPLPNHQSPRFFCSPPRKVELQSLRVSKSPPVKTSMISPSSPSHNAIKVTFNTPSEGYLSQVDGKSKKSEHTHYSSQKSQVLQHPQTPFPRSQHFTYDRDADFVDNWATKTEKCLTKKSSIQCSPGQGGETQRTLIDCLNEDRISNGDEQMQCSKNRNSYANSNFNPQARPISYAIKNDYRVPMLKNHHHTVIFRAMPNTNLQPCRVPI